MFQDQQNAQTSNGFVETLEDRRLMSVAAAVSNGILFVRGSEYNDRIVVRQVNNRLYVDGVNGSAATWQVRAIAIDARGGNDTVVLMNPVLQAGTQYIYKPAVIAGGWGNDLITGGAATDVILGGDGNDEIYGTWGNDLIAGGWGDDYLHGGTGNDRIAGEQGNDRILGSDGNDVIDGGAGFDQLNGGYGTNYLVDDYLGANRVYGGGYDYVKVRYPTLSPSALPFATGTPITGLSALIPQTQSVTPFKDFLQGTLGGDLYQAIVVDQRIPNMFRRPLVNAF